MIALTREFNSRWLCGGLLFAPFDTAAEYVELVFFTFEYMFYIRDAEEFVEVFALKREFENLLPFYGLKWWALACLA